MIERSLPSDPVFQLNTFLWALQDLPDGRAAGSIQPVLRDAGYSLVAVGRRVFVPSDPSVKTALKHLRGSPDSSPCRPDLWLKHSEHPVHLVVELKGRGFSSDSSNTKQALKLLVSAFDLSSSLGVQAECPGHVVYGTVSTDASKLLRTLEHIADKIRAEDVQPAPTAVVGFSIEYQGVALSSPTPSHLPDPAARALASSAVVLHRDEKNDLLPLYFVPWIPGIEETQDPELHSDGLRELTARLLTHTMSHIGRAHIPTTPMLNGDRLLRDATFGVFDRWREQDRKKFSEAAAKIVKRALKSRVEIRRKGGNRLEIDLPTAETRDEAITRLEQADPGNSKKNLETVTSEPPSLFDGY